ncbi:hypothetical protein FOIG_16525 [Fusarium odoratissimum NRRL 54006]|uniref:Uncharacterized protein n=1 Tax=Fusarium odoratissimum (strain NRRL 54006) TaxID=1089451 RepID=X0IMW6_FUSO5|nr:uncharacterized protein FOIG_16525 [Fusarium odoratissimum NRRL 54006]EXL90207.1 hypothetical protein FOIG_16525 [Fusarium odoratissimum NRRL 54006]
MMLGQGDDSTIPGARHLHVRTWHARRRKQKHPSRSETGERRQLYGPARYSRQGSPGPPDRRRYRAPFWPAGGDTVGVRDDERLPLHWYAPRYDPPDAYECQDRVPKETAMAASRCLTQRAAMCASVCMYGLQGAGKNVRSGGAGSCEGPGPPTLMARRSRANATLIAWNTVPAEMAQAELRLEQLSEETLKGAESRDWLE